MKLIEVLDEVEGNLALKPAEKQKSKSQDSTADLTPGKKQKKSPDTGLNSAQLAKAKSAVQKLQAKQPMTQDEYDFMNIAMANFARMKKFGYKVPEDMKFIEKANFEMSPQELNHVLQNVIHDDSGIED